MHARGNKAKVILKEKKRKNDTRRVGGLRPGGKERNRKETYTHTHHPIPPSKKEKCLLGSIMESSKKFKMVAFLTADIVNLSL